MQYFFKFPVVSIKFGKLFFSFFFLVNITYTIFDKHLFLIILGK